MAAAQLLGGPNPLPPSEATAAATLQFFCTDPPGPAQDEAATAPANDAPTMHVGERPVSDGIHRMHAGAQPGGSGTRTGHIKALLLAPGSAGLAQQRCQRWAACSLPAAVVVPFMGLVARPLDKGGGKVRPIVLGEVLAKLALSSTIDAPKGKFDEALTAELPDLAGQLPTQLGMTQADGAHQFLQHAGF